ncbi:hypothetical protein T439DRAFT_380396 [Meredithblackwellia eburnea MCA 4105]
MSISIPVEHPPSFDTPATVDDVGPHSPRSGGRVGAMTPTRQPGARPPRATKLNKMGVIRIKTSEQYKDVINGDGLTAIEFCELNWLSEHFQSSHLPISLGAPWEEPCKALSPKFDGYSQQDRYNKTLKFYRVDICAYQDVAMDSGVTLAPTYHFYKDGAKVGEYVGSSYPALERSLASHLKA